MFSFLNPLRNAARASQQRLADAFGHTLAWRLGRPALRTARVVGACSVLYGVGYSNGVATTLEDPEGATRSLLVKLLSQQAGGAGVLDHSDERSQLVGRIGQELLVAALQKLKQDADEASTKDPKSEQAARAKLQALQRHHWRFVVVDTDKANAFVSDQLPGFVFVNRGLIEKFGGREDELAFILAHELGHYISNHDESQRKLQGAFAALQV